MTEEEYLDESDKQIDEMSIEDLRAYTKRINHNSQLWFHNWMKTKNELQILEVQFSLLKMKVDAKKFTTDDILKNFKEFFTKVGVDYDTTKEDFLIKYMYWLEKNK